MRRYAIAFLSIFAGILMGACAPAVISRWHVQVLPESEENRDKLRECQVLNNPTASYHDGTAFLQCLGTIDGYEIRTTTTPAVGSYPEQSWVDWWQKKLGVTDRGCKPTQANFTLFAQMKSDTYWTIFCPQTYSGTSSQTNSDVHKFSRSYGLELAQSPGSEGVVVKCIWKGWPGEQGGLLPGDKIRSADTVSSGVLQELVSVMRAHGATRPEEPLILSVSRSDATNTVSLINPRPVPEQVPSEKLCAGEGAAASDLQKAAEENRMLKERLRRLRQGQGQSPQGEEK